MQTKNERGPLNARGYEYIETCELYALQAKAAAYDRMIKNNAAISVLLMEMRGALLEEMRHSFQEAASLEEMMRLYKSVKEISQDAEQALTG